MKRIEISQNVYQYSFDSADRSFSDNIFVVHKNNKALIIDTAFEENARKVKDDLKNLNISPEIVVISHFHDDHIKGNSIFKECHFYVHPVYSQQVQYRDLIKKNFEECNKISFVQNGMTIPDFDVDIKLYFAPGHHISGLTILIEDKIVFANDLIIYSHDGKMVIPYIDSGSTIEEHISSLLFIKELQAEILISGHGPIIGESEISVNVDKRIHYLQKLSEIGSEAKIEQCLEDSLSNYSHLGFHFSNLQKVYKQVL